MEDWSFVSQSKGFMPDDSISAQDVIGRAVNGSLAWDVKTPSTSENNFGVTIEEGIKNQGFGVLGTPELIQKPWDVSSPAGSVVYSGGDEPSSRFSSSVVVDASTLDSSLIDLNLGRLADHRETLNFGVDPVKAPVERPTPAKRVRASFSSQVPFCQVHGCRKDLSSCKDYCKRHKVCEIHSKTAKVIENGIEKRFCQQCSRFHLLDEFDDGKRSCRKRLAVHNERRRKPRGGAHTGRIGRPLHYDFGATGSSRPQDGLLTVSSCICQNILPTSLVYPFDYNSNDWIRHKKPLKDGTNCRVQSEITIIEGYSHLNSTTSYAFAKNFPPFHLNEVGASSGGGDMNETADKNSHDDFLLFDSASAVQGGLTGISASGRAHSLLSSQSRNSLTHSSGALFPQVSINGLFSNKIDSADLISVEGNHNTGLVLISDEIGAVNFDSGKFHGSDVNCKGGRLCWGEEGTIDLLQLSSQLQRVEHEREYVKMKQDNDAICGLKIT